MRSTAPAQSSRFAKHSMALLALTGILLHLLFRFASRTPPLTQDIPLFVVLIVCGIPLIIDLAKKLFTGEFGSDLLAGLSITVAVIQQQYLVAAIVVLMLSGGTALEAYASRRASAVLDALAKRIPNIVHRKTAQGLADVSLNQIAVSDVLVLFPHEICPADGVVTEGHGRMNEAYLTGEPFEISKAPGSKLISGAINGDTSLTMRVEHLPVDSRYARIVRVMEENQQRRPRLRRLGDRLGAWYTPVAVVIAIAAWAATGQSARFLAVLVIATPCPLLIAIPVAVIGAISLSAHHGIIIRNPAILEKIDSCQTFIFDKTGTLTYGRPAITGIFCVAPFTPKDALRVAASLELYSRHPLAQAIVQAAQSEGIALDTPSEVQEPPGAGLRGTIDGKTVELTSRSHVKENAGGLPPAGPGLECVLLVDGRLAATFQFRDAPRKDGAPFVRHLGTKHHVNRLLLVSGDRESEVRYLAGEVGITDIYSGKSPEDKVEIVRDETTMRETVFIGDGTNDAPAMQMATIGIALGQGSDVAAEAADAVILDSSLERVDELIHIGRRMKSIAMLSAVGGMAISIAGMFAAAFGYLAPVEGAIAQEVIDLLAVLNAVRVIAPLGPLKDF